MLALVFATEDESFRIRKVLGKANFLRISNVDIYTYIVDDNLFYLFHTGVGKVNAASTLSRIISFFSIDHVLNIGVAGGTGKNINKSDIVLANATTYHDVDLTFFKKYKMGQLPQMPEKFNCEHTLTECCFSVLGNQSELTIHKGLIVTGDQFICQKNVEDLLKNFPNCLAVDMEAAALSQVCYLNKIFFSSLKIISDLPANGFNEKSYSQSVETNTSKIAKFIPDVLRYFFYTKNHTVI